MQLTADASWVKPGSPTSKVSRGSQQQPTNNKRRSAFQKLQRDVYVGGTDENPVAQPSPRKRRNGQPSKDKPESSPRVPKYNGANDEVDNTDKPQHTATSTLTSTLASLMGFHQPTSATVRRTMKVSGIAKARTQQRRAQRRRDQPDPRQLARLAEDIPATERYLKIMLVVANMPWRASLFNVFMLTCGRAAQAYYLTQATLPFESDNVQMFAAATLASFVPAVWRSLQPVPAFRARGSIIRPPLEKIVNVCLLFQLVRILDDCKHGIFMGALAAFVAVAWELLRDFVLLTQRFSSCVTRGDMQRGETAIIQDYIGDRTVAYFQQVDTNDELQQKLKNSVTAFFVMMLTHAAGNCVSLWDEDVGRQWISAGFSLFLYSALSFIMKKIETTIYWGALLTLEDQQTERVSEILYGKRS